MGWPKQVPILTARDIHKGSLQSGDRCCLVGWGWKVFHARGFGLQVTRKVWSTIDEVIGTDETAEWNDDKRRTKREIAEAWNEAMRRLGYTEVFDVED